MIVIDPIIFKLQKYGGVSKYFNELIFHLEKNKLQYILLQNERFIFKFFPIFIKRFFPVDWIYSDFIKNSTFISSYYTYSIHGRDILIFHDFTHEIYYKFRLKTLIFFLLKRICLLFANKVVCISNTTKSDLKRFHNFNVHNIHVIYNGITCIEPEYFDMDFNDFYIFIGSRAKYKRFDYAVSLCVTLNKKLVIIGGGKFSQLELELLSDCDYKFYDFLPTEHYYYCLKMSNGVFYPSCYEGFGIPSHETYYNSTPFFYNENCLVLNEISLPNSCALTMNIESDINIIKNFEFEKEFDRTKINFWHEVFDKLLKN